MLATIINAVLVVFGTAIGILFKNKISERFTQVLMSALALVVAMMGIQSAITTENTLGMIICVIIGTLIGEGINIEKRLDRGGEKLKHLIEKNSSGGNFTQGFVNASLLFCVGSMAIMGSMEAGINHNYSIILSKAVIDCIAAISFASVLGIGVGFSAISVLVYQGILTLLAIWVEPFLNNEAMLTEISAVGGILLMGVAFNMLFPEKHLHVGNMLPSMFMPILYLPFVSWLNTLL